MNGECVKNIYNTNAKRSSYTVYGMKSLFQEI